MLLSKKLVKLLVSGLKKTGVVQHSTLYLNDKASYCFCLINGYVLFLMSLDGKPLPEKLDYADLKGVSCKDLVDIIPLSGDVIDLAPISKEEPFLPDTYVHGLNKLILDNESIAAPDNLSLNYKYLQYLNDLFKTALNKRDFYLNFKVITGGKIKLAYNSNEVSVMGILTPAAT